MPLFGWVTLREHLIELADQHADLVGSDRHFFDGDFSHVALLRSPRFAAIRSTTRAQAGRARFMYGACAVGGSCRFHATRVAGALRADGKLFRRSPRSSRASVIRKIRFLTSAVGRLRQW